MAINGGINAGISVAGSVAINAETTEGRVLSASPFLPSPASALAYVAPSHTSQREERDAVAEVAALVLVQQATKDGWGVEPAGAVPID